MIVAAAQLRCRPGDVAGNLALHRDALRAAREAGASLCVFPELSLTDYESRPDTDVLARPADASELASLAAEAGPVTAVVGFIERGADGRIFNAAAILAGGRVAGIHRKLNLPGYGALAEPDHYAPGDDLAVYDTPAGRLGVLVCADTWDPSLPWLAALGGAGILAVPIASSRGAVSADFDSRDGWDVNTRHTALTYGLPTITANHCGRRGGLDFWGGSFVADASGRIVARAGEEPELLLAFLDPTDTALARARLPTIRDTRPDLVRRMLERRDATLPLSH